MKKFITLLLACSMLAAMSCGSADTPVSDDTTRQSDTSDTTAAETEPAPDLPESDFGGYEFRVLHDVTGWGTYSEEHLDFESENGDVLDDAIFRRNRSVEEEYGFALIEVIGDYGATANTLTQSVMAGDDEYDLAMITYGWACGTDLLVDFNTIPYIDLTMPWWNTNAAEQLSVGGVLTNALSDFMITHRDGTVAMFFNKKLAEDYGVNDLYSLVRDGKWTLDKFGEYARLVTGDLNGDGNYTDADLFGYSAINTNSYIYMLFGAGATYTKNDENDLPVVSMNNEAFVDRYMKVVNLLNSDNLLYCPKYVTNKGGDGDQSIFRVFRESRALFMSHGIGSASKLRDMEDDFGVLPAPKYDEAQEDYKNIIDAGKYMVVPNTASDLERTGIILEALSYGGYKTVIPSYYNTMLKNKLMRDEESIEMLDEYIFPNSVLKGFFNSNCSEIIENLAKSPDKIASTIASREESIQLAIDKIVATMVQ